MKKIFIYYSLSGNGDLVSEHLKKMGYEICKVEPMKKMPKLFFLQILTGGFMATINYKSKLKNFNIDINKYDEVVIGSPIWNDRISSPINEVLNILDLHNKKLSFILYSGSGKAGKASERINKEYPHAKITVLREPKRNKDFYKELN